MSLINTRLLQDFALNESSEEIKLPITSVEDVEMTTPSVDKGDLSDIQKEHECPIERELKDPTMTADERRELEYKIETTQENLSESIVNTCSEINRLLYESINEIDAISINGIHEQFKILSESAYGSDLYNENMSVLIEATTENIFTKIINWITTIIDKCGKFFRDLGLSISVSFTDYEKFVDQNEKELMEKANSIGDRVGVELSKWDTKRFLKRMPLDKLYSIADEIVKPVDSKDSMEDVIDDLKDKGFNPDASFGNAVYCKAFVEIYGEYIKLGDITDRADVRARLRTKARYDSKVRYMNKKKTKNFLNELRNYKKTSGEALSATKNAINPNFNRLKKELDREIRSRSKEGKDDTIKSMYFKYRFYANVAIQDAVTDVIKMQTELIKEYSKEMFRGLKALKHYKETSNNESIDFNESQISGYTLHE